MNEYMETRLDLRESFSSYIIDGIEPGGFLMAVLENDLKESFGRADLENRAHLFEIVSYCYNMVPSTCWGSPEIVKKWIKLRREKGSL